MRAKLINQLFERSMNDFTSDEVITRDFINFQWEKGYLNPYAAQYAWAENEENIDTDDEDIVNDILETDKFKDWLTYELEARLEDFKDKIYYHIKNNEINLYRSMMVKPDYLESLKSGHIKRIGRYWTYDEEKAEPHWGYNNPDLSSEIIFHIIINETLIDWLETFRLNLEHKFYNEEDEIRLFKNTPIIINDILWNGTKISLKDLKQIKKYKFKS